MAAVAITSRDRLGFTLFLAISLHAAIILGVSFTSGLNLKPSPTIEVTIAQHNDREIPEDADFIAQANQLGSGTADEVLETTTEQQVDFHDNKYSEVISDPTPTTHPTIFDKRELLTTVTSSEAAATTEQEVPVEETISSFNIENLSYDDLAKEIASLEARISEARQTSARRPRVKRLTSVSTKSAYEAAYLNTWRKKVERIGTANYPGKDGNLRMLVVLRFDGTLQEVRILESSGDKTLDNAALRIVRQGAPFQNFPVEMRKAYDRLEIIRTWKFSRARAQLGS
ncbi:MAG: TonB family protein [Gammaproteobacteria bacterium]|nr:TonB family protein [Gammaproteobacteria bacterium]